MDLVFIIFFHISRIAKPYLILALINDIASYIVNLRNIGV